MKTINQKSQKNSLCLREPQTPIREPQTPNDLTTLQNSPSARWRGGWGVRLLGAGGWGVRLLGAGGWGVRFGSAQRPISGVVRLFAMLLCFNTLHAQWTQILPHPLVTGDYNFYDMATIGDDTIFVAGGTTGTPQIPFVYKSYDGGQTWSNTNLTTYASNLGTIWLETVTIVAHPGGLLVVSGSGILGSSQSMLYSPDFGDTWFYGGMPLGGGINELDMAPNGNIFATWGDTEIFDDSSRNRLGTIMMPGGGSGFFQVLDNDTWIASSHTLNRTDNAGQNWRVLLPFGVQDVFFTDSLQGFATDGYYRIYRTLDAGTTWDTINIPNFMFGGIAPLRVRHLSFIDSTNGVAGLWGLCFTSNGGQTWELDSMGGVLHNLINVKMTKNNTYALSSSVLMKKSMLTFMMGNITNPKILIFPNPSTQTIKIQSQITSGNVIIYDFTGKIIFNSKLEPNMFLDLPSGINLITIYNTNNERIHTQKIVKE